MITSKGTVDMFLTIFKNCTPFFLFSTLEVMLSDLYKPERVDNYKPPPKTETECLSQIYHKWLFSVRP